jgi:hypothetical protein
MARRKDPKLIFRAARLSDIDITRVYNVECPDHGVVDAPKTYAEAVAARRYHFENVKHGFLIAERAPD